MTAYTDGQDTLDHKLTRDEAGDAMRELARKLREAIDENGLPDGDDAQSGAGLAAGVAKDLRDGVQTILDSKDRWPTGDDCLVKYMQMLHTLQDECELAKDYCKRLEADLDTMSIWAGELWEEAARKWPSHTPSLSKNSGREASA